MIDDRDSILRVWQNVVDWIDLFRRYTPDRIAELYEKSISTGKLKIHTRA